MNLLISILKSSQRGKPRPWYSHRYIGRFLILIGIVFAYQYYSYNSPRDYKEILNSKILRVGYIKSPEVAFEYGTTSAGFELDIIKRFAQQKNLDIELIQASERYNHIDPLLGLNANRYDILIGHFALNTLQSKTVDSDITHKEKYQTLYQETQPWLESNAIIFEHKELQTPKSILDNDAIIYVDNSFPVAFVELEANKIQTVKANKLIKRVNSNKIQYGLTTITKLRINRKYYPQIRQIKKLNAVTPIVWRLPKKNSNDLLTELNEFIQNPDTQRFIYQRKRFWITPFKYINFLDVLTLSKKIKSRLPKLRSTFKSAGEDENVDWLLIAALSYQESHWDVDAVSPTNVRGIMQLTKVTAQAMGIKDRTNVRESIHAAIRYLKELEQRIPVKAKREDRIWMAVAAYNLGISRVLGAYRTLQKKKVMNIDWQNIAYQLNLNSIQLYRDIYTNGKKAVNYVERIKEFREVLRYHLGD